MYPPTAPCRICGAQVAYFRYGVISCEACRCFFKKTVNQTGLQCLNRTDNCVIDVKTRTYCSKCRLQKCLVEGMKKELHKSISPCKVCGSSSSQHCCNVPLCFACSAFWRQHGKNDNLECLSGTKNCVMTEEDRKCKRCRRQKCVDVGLRPEWIATKKQIQCCVVCSEPTSRLYSDLTICRACKEFFRYNVREQPPHPRCKSKNCVITPENRKVCGECRFEKCLQVGLQPELVPKLKKQLELRRNKKMVEPSPVAISSPGPTSSLYQHVDPGFPELPTYWNYDVSGTQGLSPSVNATLPSPWSPDLQQLPSTSSVIGNAFSALSSDCVDVEPFVPGPSEWQWNQFATPWAPRNADVFFPMPTLSPQYPLTGACSNHDQSLEYFDPMINQNATDVPVNTEASHEKSSSFQVKQKLSKKVSAASQGIATSRPGSSRSRKSKGTAALATLNSTDVPVTTEASTKLSETPDSSTSSRKLRTRKLPSFSAASQEIVTSTSSLLTAPPSKPSRSRKSQRLASSKRSPSLKRGRVSPSPAPVQDHFDVPLTVSTPPGLLITTFNAQTLANIVECLTAIPFLEFRGLNMAMTSAKFVMWIANSNLKNFVENRVKMHPMVKELKAEDLNSMLQTSWIALHIIDVAYATINDKFQDDCLLGNGERVTSAEIGLLGCKTLIPQWQDLLQKFRSINCSPSTYAVVHTMLIFLNNADQFQKIVDYVGEEWSTKASAIFEIVGGIRGLTESLKAYVNGFLDDEESRLLFKFL